jgi:small subunit ribosomal protein S1
MSNEPQPSAAETDPTTASADSPAAANVEQAAGSDPNASTPNDSPKAPEPPETGSETAAAKTVRGSGPLAARGLGVAKPASPSVSSEELEKAEQKSAKKKKKKGPPRPRVGGERTPETPTPETKPKPSKVAVPSVRAGLSEDLEAELEAELAAADVESMLGGAAGMPERREPLAEGTRVNAQVLKTHQDSVYVALGGPDEGVVPFEQFTDSEPTPGQSIDVLVRGFNRADGLYMCTLPGATIDAADWSDLEEGAVVEAVVTGQNSGGLECKVGAVRAFMPISQITEYRVEDVSEFVGQKMICLVTEANERRGNLVLSRRAILEREREQKRKEQLEKIEPGDTLEGTVRSVKDFGAFVDLGGLDGLIHVSKLSWERIKHPSEVLEEGQKVKVKVDTVDKESGKIGLSYRDLLENPWDSAEADFAVGTIHKGTVTRIASFGCFVRLAAGVEGLVHVSELAHHRVSKVDAFVSEGQEVEVKVLSFDRDSQKIGLSMKAAKKIAEDDSKPKQEEVEEPQREVAVKPAHQGPLKGGNDRDTGGERFGLRW